MLDVTRIEEKTEVKVYHQGGTIESYPGGTNNKMIISFNADVFIVPNAINTIDDFFPSVREEMIETVKGMYVENGDGGRIYGDTSKPLVQLWVSAKDDLDCGNLGSHGADIKLEDGKTITILPTRVDHMPVNFFSSLKEGDTVTVVMPYKTFREDLQIEGMDEVELRIHMTLAQKKYRYRDHGTFEDLLAKLTKHFYAGKAPKEG